MGGNQEKNDLMSFQGFHGRYLSAEGDNIHTKRHCSADEKFQVVKVDTQYAFMTRSGKYLSVIDREPFITVSVECDETCVFQLFSLMMFGVNVGKQLELLEKHGHVSIGGLLDSEQLEELKSGTGSGPMSKTEHEKILTGLVGQGPGFAQLATHPLVLQIVRRAISPACKLSSVLSCRTDADYVRKELEQTDWRVIHPYSAVEFPGIVDERISFTATWFLDDLDSDNSTWAWLRPPTTDGTHSPQLPQLSSREEIETIIKSAKPLHASSGSVWLYVGPMWLSNNIGAASFWKDYDAQTRYKHFSGQKPQDGSFRALADSTGAAIPKESLCPTLIQATYVREYVGLFDPVPPPDVLAAYGENEREELRQLLSMW